MILDRIISHKIREVELLKRDVGARSLVRSVDRLPPAKSLARGLIKPGRVALLAEIKRASPSRGIIREDFDPCEIAGIYSQNGADAISVLTDGKFFGGHPDHLARVRKITSLPILRKDFIIDPVQIYQARLLGADAVLLICAVLPPKDLRLMLRTAAEAGMDALTEVHGQSELETALEAGAILIGINNRDLKTFKTDLNTTFRLCPQMPKGTVAVSESGINSAEDVRRLKDAGVSAALVGEALMSAGDMAAKVRELSCSCLNIEGAGYGKQQLR